MALMARSASTAAVTAKATAADMQIKAVPLPALRLILQPSPRSSSAASILLPIHRMTGTAMLFPIAL